MGKDNLDILYITTAFARSKDDPVTPWLTKTIEGLMEKGLNVDVFTSAYKGLTFNRIGEINVYRFRYFLTPLERLTHEEMTLERMKKGFIYKILPVFYLLFGTAGIINHCLKKDYDIIHVHWPFPHFIFAIIASRICRAPIVSTFHGVGLRYISNSTLNLNLFMQWVVKKSDLITVNSTHTASELDSFETGNLAIVPFGASVEPREENLKTESSDSPGVLFVGRLVERKGVEYLIEAIGLLKGKIEGLNLTIVGDGNRREYLENKMKELNLEEEITFLGRVEEGQLIENYRKCDVFVLPAVVDSSGDTEGLGVVLLEAMNFKKPVIASKVGGITDIVKDGKTGILVEEKKPEEIALAIEQVLTDREFREKLAINGYEFVRRNYNWDSIVNSLHSQYKKLIYK